MVLGRTASLSLRVRHLILWTSRQYSSSLETRRFKLGRGDASRLRGHPSLRRFKRRASHDRNLSTRKSCGGLRTNYERQGAVPRCFDNVMIRPQVLSVLDGDLNRTWCEEGELGTKPWGHSYQVRERLSFHLSHHLASVCLYRDLADG